MAENTQQTTSEDKSSSSTKEAESKGWRYRYLILIGIILAGATVLLFILPHFLLNLFKGFIAIGQDNTALILTAVISVALIEIVIAICVVVLVKIVKEMAES